MGDGDRLAAVNDELRRLPPERLQQTRWLPLESNPELMTRFSRQLGLPQEWEWQDVLGLDPELAQMVPRPCCAALLLFPCSRGVYAMRERQRRGGMVSPPPAGVWYLVQHAGFGNACGTIAALHALANTRAATALRRDGPLSGFVDRTESASAGARGEALLHDAGLRGCSDAAAADAVAQTALPARDGPDLDHHFCAFAAAAAAGGGLRLLEIDGTRDGVVDHGATTADGFLDDVCRAVTCTFVAADPSSIEFSMIALVRPGG